MVRITDCPNMTLAVYLGHKARNQSQISFQVSDTVPMTLWLMSQFFLSILGPPQMPTTRPLPVKKVDHIIAKGRLTIDHACVLGRVRALIEIF